MNDAVIIVAVVLFVGVVATVVFVIWRSRYQPVKNPFRVHNDAAPAEHVVIRESQVGPGAAASQRDTGQSKHASHTRDDGGDLLLRGMAIGHIASALHGANDPSHQSPSASSAPHAPDDVSGRANDPASDPFSSDSSFSSDGGGADGGDSGGGSE